MSKWETVKLGEICTVEAGGTPSRSKKEYWGGEINWVAISDFNGKYIKATKESISDEGLSKSSAKLFYKGTILYTIFATIGEVAILDIDATTNQAIAGVQINSTEVEQNYLYLYLKGIKESVVAKGRGVAQNNINLGILRNLEVVLPPLETQIKIANELDNITKLIEMRKQQIEKLDLLVKAKFIEMFGDPVENPMGWEECKLTDLGTIARGKSKHRPRNDERLLGGNYPLVQTGDVANAKVFLKKYNSTYSEFGLSQSKMWKKGTLCITIAANIAKTAMLEFDACFPDSVVGFIANKENTELYILYWFEFWQKSIESAAPESAQKNINLKILSDLMVMQPPKELQDEFKQYIYKCEGIKDNILDLLELLETLYKSKMQEYFG